MSTRFQQELKGNIISTHSTAIPYSANVTFKSKAEKSYLHSHIDAYPLRYADDRVSSKGQQVTGYTHADHNNKWSIVPVYTVDGVEKDYEHSKEELARGVRYLRDGDIVRLLHVSTNSYLMSHDVASPLTTTNMEITTYNNPNDTRYADTLWRIEMQKPIEGQKLKSKRDMIRIINHKFKVAVLTSKKKLPKWGFEQQEINGSKNLKEDVGTIWFVDDVEHERIANGMFLLT